MCDLFDRSTQTSATRTIGLGVPALNSDQRCLFRIVDLLGGIEDDVEAEAMISAVLEMFSRYSAFHFRRQERVMVAVRYPEIAVHRAEHLAFSQWLEDKRRECGEGADPSVASQLREQMTGWLNHHVLLQDVPIAPYITDPAVAEATARDGTATCLIDLPAEPQIRPPDDFGPYAASALAT